MKILLTGMAGFIGMHTALDLLARRPSAEIVGLDNLNAYYDPALKYGRLKVLGFERTDIEPERRIQSRSHPSLSFVSMELKDAESIGALFAAERFDAVIHLAAQAGVRYSLQSPQTYIDSNVTGFLNILEGCRKFPVRHLIYASSSSVYGLNTHMPFSETDRVDRQASLYADTKKMNEAMAHTYGHLFQIPSSGLRFFTVYGEWGRPDMSPILFCERILAGKPIRLFNNGDMQRDFTYVGDIVRGVVDLLDHPPGGNLPVELYNIGNNAPVQLDDFVRAMEVALGCEAIIEYAPMQPGDVPATWADSGKLHRVTGFAPSTLLSVGLARFADWYRAYYGV